MPLPTFLIIGAQRCGTTSLFSYLSRHPAVVPPTRKEVHYFDLHYDKGTDWYLQQFSASLPSGKVTGEASPYYLFHPLVPQRVQQLLPAAKLIVLLRNPMVRAYSHYHHEVRLGAEKLSFEAALEEETLRLQGETEKMRSNANYYSFNHQHFSYVSRGEYITQLLAWTQCFSRDQMLIVRSEDLYADPANALRAVVDFIGLPAGQPSEYRKPIGGNYPPMSEAARMRLTDHFAPWNERLYEFLGRDLGWDSQLREELSTSKG